MPPWRSVSAVLQRRPGAGTATRPMSRSRSRSQGCPRAAAGRRVGEVGSQAGRRCGRIQPVRGTGRRRPGGRCRSAASRSPPGPGAAAVLEPDLRRVGARRALPAARPESIEVAVPVQHVGAEDVAGRAEHAVVDRGDRARRVGPVQGRSAARRASFPRHRRRAGRRVCRRRGGSRRAPAGSGDRQRKAGVQRRCATVAYEGRRSGRRSWPELPGRGGRSGPARLGGCRGRPLRTGGRGSYSIAPLPPARFGARLRWSRRFLVSRGVFRRLRWRAAPALARIRPLRLSSAVVSSARTDDRRSSRCVRVLARTGAGTTPVATQAAAPPDRAGAEREHLGQRGHAGAAGAARGGDLGGAESPPPPPRQAGGQAGQRVVGAIEQRARAAGAGAQGGRGPRRRAVGAHRRPAVRAGPQVLAQRRDRLARARLAVAEGRRAAAAARAQRLPSSLRGDEAAEALPALGQAAVDLGLAEAGDLADLGVGVALGEQGQGAQLGGFSARSASRLRATSSRRSTCSARAVAARPGSAPRSPRPPSGAAAGRPRSCSRSARTASASCLITVWVQRISSRGSVGRRLGQERSRAPAGRRPRRRRRRASSAARCAAASLS